MHIYTYIWIAIQHHTAIHPFMQIQYTYKFNTNANANSHASKTANTHAV